MKLSRFTLFFGAICFLFVIVAFIAPWLTNDSSGEHSQLTKGIFPLYRYGPETPDISDALILEPPGIHWFGTDSVGRDVLSRIIYANRNALAFSVAVTLFCLLLGSFLGGIMGFFGGKIDMIFSRIMEVIGNFPIFFLQLTLLAFFDRSYWILFLVMIIAGWIPYCRFTRAEFLKLRNQEFVQAANALGSSRWRIFFRHLLPNSLTPLLIYIPFDLSGTIVALGALSFLGLGEPINVASFGELLQQAQDHFQVAWWLAVFPGATLFLLTLSLTVFGSGIRDYLDPRET